ncbi:hypothetical protein N866_15910 [Actinotalea ferrariae CF5-4]|uniref:Uncharacterized protein n=1 Tax=Actinotalea ferrariae CF5-4 TaxID=948458 RepID=A0A021VSA2_9CELL|nr:hypothetical protein N866_15910 [Actinotalea ferrariae CF5-4]
MARGPTRVHAPSARDAASLVAPSRSRTGEHRVRQARGSGRGQMEVQDRLDELQLEHRKPPVEAQEVDAGVGDVERHAAQEVVDTPPVVLTRVHGLQGAAVDAVGPVVARRRSLPQHVLELPVDVDERPLALPLHRGDERLGDEPVQRACSPLGVEHGIEVARDDATDPGGSGSEQRLEDDLAAAVREQPGRLGSGHRRHRADTQLGQIRKVRLRGVPPDGGERVQQSAGRRLDPVERSEEGPGRVDVVPGAAQDGDVERVPVERLVPGHPADVGSPRGQLGEESVVVVVQRVDVGDLPGDEAGQAAVAQDGHAGAAHAGAPRPALRCAHLVLVVVAHRLGLRNATRGGRRSGVPVVAMLDRPMRSVRSSGSPSSGNR